MTVPEHIAKTNGATRISYELLPPVKGSSINSIFNTIDQLKEFNPPFINITYHAEETTYSPQPDGSFKAQIIRKRPGTVAIGAAIKSRYGIDVVPHIICGNFTKQETEDALIDLDFLGITNLLVLRGDGDKLSGRFKGNPDGHMNASGLLQQIMDMNRGIYQEKYVDHPSKTNFSVGVAGYPEKHAESPNMDDDLFYLKKKVDLGAEYIVTQMFFDNRKFFDFVKKCRDIGITVPIIPGIKPISTKDHCSVLPRIFHLTMPNELTREVNKCTSNKEVKKFGIEWTTAQIKELVANGFNFIHIYTMGKVDHIAKISENVI